jgi:Fur family peroxide stress response transcriptional regulator
MMARLRAAGHRVTPQRMAVIRLLASTTRHPSAEELFAGVIGDQPGIGLATIYNTIDLLHGLGEILVLDLGEGFKRYDGRSPEPHPHVLCAQCGRVDDVDGIDVGDLAQLVAQSSGYQVLSQRIELTGLCPACKAGGGQLDGSRRQVGAGQPTR